MLKIRLAPEAAREIERACRRAGRRETGGMLFGEHVGPDEFVAVEATVAGVGGVASFFRGLAASLRRLEGFFRRTNHDYERFNYVGEWHSHPSYALRPSNKDDETMYRIVNDRSTNARFAVLMIVKIEDSELRGAAFAYYRDEDREDVELTIRA